MRTVIYLDVLLLVNFVVGAAFLLAAGLLCGACCSPLRLVGGAGAAAVSSLALLAPTAPWPLALTYKGTSAALCVAAAYGWQGARNTARLTAWFVLLNLTLTGALFLPGAACNNLSFYLPVSPGLLLASTAGVCGVVEGVLHVLGRSGPACFGAELSVAGRVVPLSVFCDTGFHLQEPLSGRAVVLVRLDAVPLPTELRAYLDACLAGVGAEPRPEWGVRFVPCQTVAGHCLLPALPGAACNNLSFYLPVSPGLLLASTAGVCGVVEGVLHVLGRSGPACFGAELSVAGRVVPLSVFCDTGFHLQEPLSGRAVVLVRLDAVPLPTELRAYLDACLAGVGAEPRPEWGVRFVPCQTVAGHCLLPALPAALGSNGRKQDGIYAAFCDMPPPPGGWTALVSAETAALLGK